MAQDDRETQNNGDERRLSFFFGNGGRLIVSKTALVVVALVMLYMAICRRDEITPEVVVGGIVLIALAGWRILRLKTDSAGRD